MRGLIGRLFCGLDLMIQVEDLLDRPCDQSATRPKSADFKSPKTYQSGGRGGTLGQPL